MARLPLAVVGAGRMGTVHARVLGGAESVDVAAIVEPVAARGAQLAGELGIRHFSTIDELLAAGFAGGVLIAAPTPAHPALVRQALEAGLPVLCEKPLSLDVGAGERLASMAHRQGLVLQVGFWRRFSPPWASAKMLIDEGVVGRPLMIRLSQWDAVPPPPAFCDPSVSGGLAIDCGVHEYDLAEWLTGRQVMGVTAWNLPIVNRHVGDAGDVDNLVAVLELQGGAVATVDLSRNAGYEDDVRTEILGERGAIFVDLLPTGRTRLATDTGVRTVEGSLVDDALVAGLVAQADAFAAAIAGEEVAAPGPAASNRTMTIGRAVQQAGKTGERQPVPG